MSWNASERAEDALNLGPDDRDDEETMKTLEITTKPWSRHGCLIKGKPIKYKGPRSAYYSKSEIVAHLPLFGFLATADYRSYRKREWQQNMAVVLHAPELHDMLAQLVMLHDKEGLPTAEDWEAARELLALVAEEASKP